MAFKPGYLGHFSLDNAAGSLQNLSAYIDNVSNTQSTETLDVSALGTAFKAYMTGQHDGSFTISGPYDKTVHTHIAGLITAYDAGTASSSVQWGPGGSVATEAKITCEAILSEYALTTSVSGRAEWSANLQITGAVTNGTF